MVNDPKIFFFFWKLLLGSGGYPNRSYETVSIGIRIGPVRRLRGWNRWAEGPEVYFQITSFMRVGGRISHSSHLSGPNPATWVRDVGQAWRRSSELGTRTELGPVAASMLSHRFPISHFMSVFFSFPFFFRKCPELLAIGFLLFLTRG